MSPSEIKTELKQAAEKYAKSQGLQVDSSWKSATIFHDISDNFFSSSFQAIEHHPEWKIRLGKKHSKVPEELEMQSSNSSDALLMNIFCHPKILQWKGIRDLLGVEQTEIRFGVEPGVAKEGKEARPTEIDMVLGDLFVEAKLTEDGFTEKEVGVVEKYLDFRTHFHSDSLAIRDGKYQNYQVIRNLLAAIQHGKRQILLCDERRPDLVRSYLETVSCLKSGEHRLKCRVVFWQEIARKCGEELREFLVVKYGIC